MTVVCDYKAGAARSRLLLPDRDSRIGGEGDSSIDARSCLIAIFQTVRKYPRTGARVNVKSATLGRASKVGNNVCPRCDTSRRLS